MNYNKFLLFGDSLTEFAFNSWMEEGKPDQFVLGAALCNAYTRRMDIVQRGFSGFNSRWGLKVLPGILESECGIVVSTIAFGSNDLCLGGHQKVPEEEFVSNIKKMILLLKAKDIKPILVGPALIDQERFEASRQEEVQKGYVRTPERFKLYSELLHKVADEEDVPMVDLNVAFQREGGDKWQELLSDGLHYSGSGYKIFFDELMATIRKFYPEYAPEKMQRKLPEWRNVLEDGSNVL
ncbi:hypothetical protein HG536_0F02660 [Torulaspora globosa]|uniref:SGNH hydrolase-type esterase domain-containing protein n=1 Tax=Torulaspora globosa TaxID=48254 RepID=A0A7G3ZKA5_9SACH|nr:uncharacterized protein HG536_0F02660 [Torulaspora globosa]QLL33941.1 hypothetical protein HG536_0F02660 [Torulaspora globosa]